MKALKRPSWPAGRPSDRTDDDEALAEGLGILRYVASGFAPAWLSVSEISLSVGHYSDAEQAVEKYLVAHPESLDGWTRLAQIRHALHDSLGELQARLQLAECEGASYDEAARVATLLNRLLYEREINFEGDQKRVIVGRVRDLMEQGAEGATATQLSRLAWICLHLKDKAAARKYTEDGLTRDPDNEYCRSLAEKLNIAIKK